MLSPTTSQTKGFLRVIMVTVAYFLRTHKQQQQRLAFVSASRSSSSATCTRPAFLNAIAAARYVYAADNCQTNPARHNRQHVFWDAKNACRPLRPALEHASWKRTRLDCPSSSFRKESTLRGFASASAAALEEKYISSDEDEDELEELITESSLVDQTLSEEVGTDNGNGDNNQLFCVTAPFPPAGDQPAAIAQLKRQMCHPMHPDKFSTLCGITGTGKTLVMAHLIAARQCPTLVLCHNKTLAAQVARELRSFLGKGKKQGSAVELFVSYYNHYVPESFSETTQKYIGKKTSINHDIDALRHGATRALLTRRNVVVVASVSCLYGLGLPSEYLNASVEWVVGERITRSDSSSSELDDENTRTANNDDKDSQENATSDSENEDQQYDDLLGPLHRMLYQRSNDDEGFERGSYQHHVSSSMEGQEVHTIILWPPHEKYPMQITAVAEEEVSLANNKQALTTKTAYRVTSIQQGTKDGFLSQPSFRIFPARHHVTSEERLEQACLAIEDELEERLKELRAENKFVEAQRLQQRTLNDVYMMRETGFCKGMENYSRHFAGRAAGEAPETLLDYMNFSSQQRKNREQMDVGDYDGSVAKPDWLLMVDESHVTLPQLRAMYAGDQSRKRNLVKHGYRLPSALDNRPLQNEEFWERVPQTLLISATPSELDLSLSDRPPVEMVLRPTHVCDPEIEVRSPEGQLLDLSNEIRERVQRGERVLAITLTKRDAEDLSKYLEEQDGIRSTFLHSGLSTDQRSNALRSLQFGNVDCLVGVNCLREGLDLPQVSLVAVFNADAEGFLRSRTALLQIVGRAARNVNGKAVFYAKRVTDSMCDCMKDTERRRNRQLAYNQEHGCEVKSTKGSSMLSIFDLLKDKIESEQPLELLGHKKSAANQGVAATLPTPIPSISLPTNGQLNVVAIETDHIPSSPGVYFWKDGDNQILYIGKANNLRSRVKSYLRSNAKHSTRIRIMLEKAASVEVVLTPSERDALVLESNLIKHYQPPFNVLLKDDDHYPYICASVGDSLPRFSCVPRPHENANVNRSYRYFGPYAGGMKEVNKVLHLIEETYDLRTKSFLVRHGSESQEEYSRLFNEVLESVFDKPDVASDDEPLRQIRTEYEEAAVLFDSKYNKNRDVVAIAPMEGQDSTAIVHVVQLRNGVVAGRFSYECKIPFGLINDEDCSVAIQTVLEKQHYPSGREMPDKRYSWFPNEVLLSHPPIDIKGLRDTIRACRVAVEPGGRRTVAIALRSKRKGPRKEANDRALLFATSNAHQAARERSQKYRAEDIGAAPSSLDGTGAKDLASLLSLDRPPSLIECYDISHTQGDYPIGSRVVFENGQPARHLYRKFNIRSVNDCDDGSTRTTKKLNSESVGNDDYASIAHVFERRFRRASGSSAQKDDGWSLPDLIVVDGGPGQLAAAIEGMSKAGIFPRINGIEAIATAEGMPTVPICALAKNQEEVFVYGKKGPVNDSPDSTGLLLLRALRDESHRFALNAHRRRRSVLKQSSQ